MRSIADDLRAGTRELIARLDPMARLQLALELGDADAAAFATLKGLSVTEARCVLAHARSLGRVASAANARRVL